MACIPPPALPREEGLISLRAPWPGGKSCACILWVPITVLEYRFTKLPGFILANPQRVKASFAPSPLSRGPKDLKRCVAHRVRGELDPHPSCRISLFYRAGLRAQRGQYNGDLGGKDQPAGRRVKEGLRQWWKK